MVNTKVIVKDITQRDFLSIPNVPSIPNIGQEILNFVTGEIEKVENYVFFRLAIVATIILLSFLFICIPQVSQIFGYWWRKVKFLINCCRGKNKNSNRGIEEIPLN